jgi:hypothetical protein
VPLILSSGWWGSWMNWHPVAASTPSGFTPTHAGPVYHHHERK